MIDYQLTRSKRKTVTIQITDTAEVLVKAPRQLPLADIEGFILKKSAWIESTRQRVLQEQQKKVAFDPIASGKLRFLGRDYPIVLGTRTAFDGVSFTVKSGSFDREKEGLILLYKKLAKEVIDERVSHYANIMGVHPTSVKITSAKTRWGSCSGKDGLCFTWKLILADLTAVDYVVVHELSHIKEHNHSPRFWRIVERALPDYRERQKQLKELQKVLNCQNWEPCAK